MAGSRRMAATMAQDAPGRESSGEGAPPPKKRVNMLQRALVLSLKQAVPDLAHKAIADAVQISESSVARILAMQVTNVKQTTEALMQTGVLERLDDWATAARLAAKKGYHQPAKDWLEAAKVIEPKPTTSVTVEARPTIVLNMPFALGALQPVDPPATAIEAHAVPVLPPTETS